MNDEHFQWLVNSALRAVYGLATDEEITAYQVLEGLGLVRDSVDNYLKIIQDKIAMGQLDLPEEERDKSNDIQLNEM